MIKYCQNRAHLYPVPASKIVLSVNGAPLFRYCNICMRIFEDGQVHTDHKVVTADEFEKINSMATRISELIEAEVTEIKEAEKQGLTRYAVTGLVKMSREGSVFPHRHIVFAASPEEALKKSSHIRWLKRPRVAEEENFVAQVAEQLKGVINGKA